MEGQWGTDGSLQGQGGGLAGQTRRGDRSGGPSRCPGWPGLVLMALVLGCRVPVAAEGSPCGDRPIRLAFYEFGSLYFRDAAGQAQGIDKDLLDLLAEHSGCSFQTQVMSSARIWADLASGAIQMSLAGIETGQRREFAHFIPYLSMKNYTILRGDLSGEVKQAEDFLARTSLRFGVVRSFRHGQSQDRWLEQLRAQGRVDESPDVETLFAKLRYRRLDAIFSQPPVFHRLIERHQLQDWVHIQDLAPQDAGVPFHLILAKSRFSEQDAQYWAALVENLRGDGSLARVFGRYLPVAEAESLSQWSG